MKRQLIYYTHVSTNREQSAPVQVQTRLIDNETKSISLKCSLDRISRVGMTLSCDKLTLNLLMPNRAGIAPKNPVTLETEFTLQSNIKASCRVIYVRRTSKNEFILELKFFDMTEKDMNLIDRFIEDSLSSGHPSTKQLAASNLPATEQAQPKPSLHKITVAPKALYSKVA